MKNNIHRFIHRKHLTQISLGSRGNQIETENRTQNDMENTSFGSASASSKCIQMQIVFIYVYSKWNERK